MLIDFSSTMKIPKQNLHEAQYRHAIHYLKILLKANLLYLSGGPSIKYALEILDADLANIRKGWEAALKLSEADEGAVGLCVAYADAGSDVLDLRQKPRERLFWLERARETAKRLKMQGFEGSLLNNLGIVYRKLGLPETAIENHQQSLVISQALGDRYGEGIALMGLGTVHVLLGDSKGAIEYYNQALVIACSRGDKRAEGSILTDLGHTAAGLCNTKKAMEYYKQALTIDQQLGDLRAEATDLGNIGTVYID